VRSASKLTLVLLKQRVLFLEIIVVILRLSCYISIITIIICTIVIIIIIIIFIVSRLVTRHYVNRYASMNRSSLVS